MGCDISRVAGNHLGRKQTLLVLGKEEASEKDDLPGNPGKGDPLAKNKTPIRVKNGKKCENWNMRSYTTKGPQTDEILDKRKTQIAMLSETRVPAHDETKNTNNP